MTGFDLLCTSAVPVTAVSWKTRLAALCDHDVEDTVNEISTLLAKELVSSLFGNTSWAPVVSWFLSLDRPQGYPPPLYPVLIQLINSYLMPTPTLNYVGYASTGLADFEGDCFQSRCGPLYSSEHGVGHYLLSVIVAVDVHRRVPWVSNMLWSTPGPSLSLSKKKRKLTPWRPAFDGLTVPGEGTSQHFANIYVLCPRSDAHFNIRNVAFDDDTTIDYGHFLLNCFCFDNCVCSVAPLIVSSSERLHTTPEHHLPAHAHLKFPSAWLVARRYRRIDEPAMVPWTIPQFQVDFIRLSTSMDEHSDLPTGVVADSFPLYTTVCRPTYETPLVRPLSVVYMGLHGEYLPLRGDPLLGDLSLRAVQDIKAVCFCHLCYQPPTSLGHMYLSESHSISSGLSFFNKTS